MTEVDLQVKTRVEDAFGLEARPWRLFHAGSVNSLYMLDTNPPVIVRCTSRHSEQHIEEEVLLTTLLRREGFDGTPRFLQARDGGWAVSTEPGAVFSAYEFIFGQVEQPLSSAHFEGLVAALPRFLEAMSRIDHTNFKGRREFPQPNEAIRRARLLFERVRAPGEVSEYLRYNVARLRGTSWASGAVIHGDLHAKNFVWRPDGSLAAIIDFERFWIGTQLIEISALITGTCFWGTVLDVQRLSTILELTRDRLRNLVDSSDTLVDTLIVVALYFFGRVNRNLLQRDLESISAGLEWRDARRAAELARLHVQLKQIVRDIVGLK
jgi:thiamine kinase-like enzyme